RREEEAEYEDNQSEFEKFNQRMGKEIRNVEEKAEKIERDVRDPLKPKHNPDQNLLDSVPGAVASTIVDRVKASIHPDTRDWPLLQTMYERDGDKEIVIRKCDIDSDKTNETELERKTSFVCHLPTDDGAMVPFPVHVSSRYNESATTWEPWRLSTSRIANASNYREIADGGKEVLFYRKENGTTGEHPFTGPDLRDTFIANKLYLKSIPTGISLETILLEDSSKAIAENCELPNNPDQIQIIQETSGDADPVIKGVQLQFNCGSRLAEPAGLSSSLDKMDSGPETAYTLGSWQWSLPRFSGDREVVSPTEKRKGLFLLGQSLSLDLPSDPAEKDSMIVDTVTDENGFAPPKEVELITTPAGKQFRKTFSADTCDRSAPVQSDVPAPGKQQKVVTCSNDTTVKFERDVRASGSGARREYIASDWIGTLYVDGKPPQVMPERDEQIIGIVKVGEETSVIGYNTETEKYNTLVEDDYFARAPHEPLVFAFRGAFSFVHGDGSANIPLVLDSKGFDRLSPEAREEYAAT
ncbi:MAG: hypothetical protein Q7S00_06855, partial [bacterium]|nr:hypothetical protein [bacterium]